MGCYHLQGVGCCRYQMVWSGLELSRGLRACAALPQATAAKDEAAVVQVAVRLFGGTYGVQVQNGIKEARST
jgi:hypothetical protein